MFSLFVCSALSRHYRGHRYSYRSAEANAQGTGYVASDIGINVRSGPSITSSIITSLPNRAQVTVTGRSGNWWAVNANGRSGYCFAEYMRVNGVVTGTGVGLNVRSGPGTNYGRVTGLSDGTAVVIQNINGDWYQIAQGWVSAQFIALSGGSSPSPSPSGGVIRQGDSRFNSNIRTWGCGFMSLCWCGGVNSIDGCNARYNQAIANGWMRADCYILSWDAIKPIAGARTYRYGGRYAGCNGNEKEILECGNARTSMHFVVGNKNNGIEYDPAYDGFVSYGDHRSKRIYGY